MEGLWRLVPLGSLMSGNRAAFTAFALACLLAVVPAGTAGAEELPRGSGFDFYVLALTWSPSYCLQAGSEGNRQCDEERDHRFVVHGLWPQFEDGYPEYCPSREPDRVPSALGRTLFDIVPSMGLIGHIWRKHGSCSGLNQKDFFKVLRAARERVVIPGKFRKIQRRETFAADEVEEAFIAANSGLTRTGIATVCERGRLQEVRICLTDDLAFRPCRKVDLAGCRADSLSVPPPE